MNVLLAMGGVWSTTNGEEIKVTERVQVGGGILPKGSAGVAFVSKISLASVTNFTTKRVEDVVSIVWKFNEGHAPDGSSIEKRTCFQKIRLWDEDEGTANKARLMMVALDNLLTGGEMRKAELDIDKESLQMLANGNEVMITVGVWQDSKTGKDAGNFVEAVAPASDYEAPEKDEEASTNTAADTRPQRTPRTPR